MIFAVQLIVMFTLFVKITLSPLAGTVFPHQLAPFVKFPLTPFDQITSVPLSSPYEIKQKNPKINRTLKCEYTYPYYLIICLKKQDWNYVASLWKPIIFKWKIARNFDRSFWPWFLSSIIGHHYFEDSCMNEIFDML